MGFWLTVDGARLLPDVKYDNVHFFKVTLPADDIRLRSGCARPKDYDINDDLRPLGVQLFGMRWMVAGVPSDVAIDTANFFDGFYQLEFDSVDGRPYRWTTGDAALPKSAIPEGTTGEAILRLDIGLWPGSDGAPDRDDAETVLAAFQSLGANCELGLAQRHYRVEPPLSLFRWSGTTFEQLLAGLMSRFVGLGDPHSTSLVWDTYDYKLSTPYLNLHTTTVENPADVDREALLTAGRATLRLLRRKLLHDIATANSIFVYRSRETPMTEDRMHLLHAAIRAIGPASLLCVTVDPDGHQGDDLVDLGDGLYMAHMDQFWLPDGPWDKWVDICGRTLALDRAYRQSISG